MTTIENGVSSLGEFKQRLLANGHFNLTLHAHRQRDGSEFYYGLCGACGLAGEFWTKPPADLTIPAASGPEFREECR